MKQISVRPYFFMKWIPSWIKNKYLLVGGAYLMYMMLLDSNNYPSQYRLYKEVKELERKHHYFRTQLEQVKQERLQLFSDEKNLEKFARENYYMKMPDETVIVVVEE